MTDQVSPLSPPIEDARADRLERSSDLLVRSAFVLALFAFLTGLVPLPFLLTVTMRAQMRTLLLVAYGAALVALLLVCGWLLITDPARLLPPARRAVRLLTRRGVALGLALLLVEANLLVWLAIRDVAPNLGALRIAAVCWTLTAFIVLLIPNWDGLIAWFGRTRQLWISTGVTLAALLLLGALYLLNVWALDRTGLLNTLRGQSDYRRLVFFGGKEDAALSRQYWTELNALQAQWLPYTYSHMEPHDGELISVEANGLRHTASFVADDQPAADVFFFGGSTVWGDGARDDYTIPSQVARLLNEGGTPARVANFGQYAYVSTQDLILFERQLALGNVPQVAVFYQGFNDMAAAYMHDMVGLPHNEQHRIQEFVMGRQLDKGNPILWRPTTGVHDLDLSLVALDGRAPETIVDHYLQNVRLARAAAAEYGVRPLFVWQPAILYKESLTEEERAFVEQNEEKWPDFDGLYREVDALLRRRVEQEGLTDVVVLSDLFQHETGYVFFDRVHLIEDGNFVVAQTLAAKIAELLSARAP